MAKLSTPYQDCTVRYVDDKGFPTGGRCQYAAYRKHEGKWYCRKHLQREKARQRPAFEVVGTYRSA